MANNGHLTLKIDHFKHRVNFYSEILLIGLGSDLFVSEVQRRPTKIALYITITEITTLDFANL